jgi:hypothetical protein
LSEDDVILSAAASFGLTKELMYDADDLDCKDCFFCTQKLNNDTVLNSIIKNQYT